MNRFSNWLPTEQHHRGGFIREKCNARSTCSRSREASPDLQRLDRREGAIQSAFRRDDPALHQRGLCLTSLKRQSEITRLAWADFEESERMLTLRDMKDPKVKIGNHFRFPLIRGAFEIVMAQPRTGKCIFPYNPHSLSQRWRLGMLDLGFPVHFHDLRREGICRMLEEGYAAHQVAAVSGHKNWNTLARVYANKFDPAELHKGPLASARVVADEQRTRI